MTIARRIRRLENAVRLPRAGHIRLGVKDDHGVPKATPYFVVPDELKPIVGEQPTEIPIIFPMMRPDEAATSGFGIYGQTRGFVCRGDGELAQRWIDLDTGAMASKDTKHAERTEIICPGGSECAEWNDCKAFMTLQAMVAGVKGLAVYQMATGSEAAMERIYSVLDAVYRALGTIAWVPFRLVLQQEEVQAPDGQRRKVYRPYITPEATVGELLQAARGEGTIALLAPGEEIEGEAIEVAEEAPMEEVSQETVDAGDAPHMEPEAKAAEGPGKRDVWSIANAGDFLTACLEDFGVLRDEALRLAELQNVRQLASPEQARTAYLTVQRRMRERAGA